MRHVHIDIETYSSVDLFATGVHAYAESPDFEILCVAYSVNYGKIKSFSPGLGEPWPPELLELLGADDVLWYAHNMAFEHACFAAVGVTLPLDRCRCTMIMAYGSGLPGSLKKLSAILKLGEAAKDEKGGKLIKKFCVPVRPTKKNNHIVRVWPEDDPEDFAELVDYCEQDVRAEIAVYRRLAKYDLPKHEWRAWAVDQEINNKGVLIDTALCARALMVYGRRRTELITEMNARTGLGNANSAAQLRGWISTKFGEAVPSTDKEHIAQYIERAKDLGDENMVRVLQLRQMANLTSIKKYRTALTCINYDDHARGIVQFMGAYRTWRWAGRRIQFQNIPRNKIEGSELATARAFIKDRPYDQILRQYPKINSTLSQLIRTMIVAPKGKKLVVCDYSAIEARVLAFVAQEKWRIDVFKSHGKIYEASASQTFGIPFHTITKDSPYRQQGKVTELALGYGGSVGAMRQMDTGNVLPEDDAEVKALVTRWRDRSINVVQFWRALESLAKRAIRNPGKTFQLPIGGPKALLAKSNGEVLRILMPSGRCLNYWRPTIEPGKYGDEIRYWGEDDRGKWAKLKTYGGKLTENFVQAYSRDLLNWLQVQVHKDHDIRFSVHDELVTVADADIAEERLDALEKAMSETPPWAEGLPLAADGFISDFYKK